MDISSLWWKFWDFFTQRVQARETIQKIYAERQELFAKNEENIKMIQSLEDAARKMKNEITVLSNEVGTQ